MATLAGVIATLLQAGGPSAAPHGYRNARLKVYSEYYIIGGSTETSGSTLDVCGTILKGSRILAFLFSVSAAQTSLTVSIGDDNSATRYGSALTTLQSAGTYIRSAVIASTGFYQVGTASGDDQIVLTTGGATMTAGTLAFHVLTALD